MAKNKKKIYIVLIIVLIMMVGVLTSASDGASTAETDKYMLAISDIIEINELEHRMMELSTFTPTCRIYNFNNCKIRRC